MAGAAGRHGVLTLGDLEALGLSRSAVHKRATVGRLHRLYRGVYSIVPPELLGAGGRRLAAVLACGPGAVLSHASAAALLGLRRSDAVYIDVTVPARSAHRHDRLRVHRSTTLTPGDVIDVDGIPSTSVARTLVDLAGAVARRPLERAFDQAEILGSLNVRPLVEQLDRDPRRRGAATVRAILEEHHIGFTPTWNDFEEAFLALVRRAGLPDPEVNAFIDPGDGEPAIKADFVWWRQRVVVETDGIQTHLTRQAFQNDRRRDQRLTVAGWRPVRTTAHQVYYRPASLERTLQALVLSPR